MADDLAEPAAALTLEEIKDQALRQAIAGREQEMMFYQINIDNYAAAIAAIDAGHDDPEIAAAMIEHRARLVKLRISEKVEQAKSKLILDGLKGQLSA